ncbi:MAG: hypothetical protein ACOVS5_19205 [Oligoflexus sp.]|jgi:hypothetical protein
MKEALVKPILVITGLVTMSPILTYFSPSQAIGGLQLLKLDMSVMIYVRHWGFMAFVLGALIVASAFRYSLRSAVLGAAVLEKLALVALIAGAWDQLHGWRQVLFFDASCAIFYIAYLWTARSRAS